MFLVIATGAGFAPSALALQPQSIETTRPVAIEMPLAQLVEDMKSADVRVRESATTWIISTPRYTLEEIEAMLQRADLTLEQRQRLSKAAIDRFAREPHGALGVQFDVAQNDKVVVDSVLKEFPAVGVLKPRDVIVACDGVPINGRYDLWGTSPIRPIVISRRPGDVVTIKVLRDNAPLELAVPLGDFNQLRPNAGLSEIEMREAWRVRQRRLGTDGKPPEAISTGLTIDRAVGQDNLDLNAFEELQRDKARAGHYPVVLPGGRARPGAIGDIELSRGDFGMWGNGGVQVAIGNVLPQGGLDYSAFAMEDLFRQRQSLRSQLVLYSQALDDRRGERGQRQMYTAMVDSITRQLTAVEREIASRERKGELKPAIAPVPDKK